MNEIHITEFNSHAGGITVARPYGFEIDFVGNSISGSAGWFLVIIFQQKFLHAKIIYLQNIKPDLQQQIVSGHNNIKFNSYLQADYSQ